MRAPLLVALAASWLSTGCMTLPVPAYEPSFDNVAALKAAAPQPLDVGAFTGGPTQLSARANPVVSSVGAGFADYLQAALAAELRRAERFLAGADVRLQGTLLDTKLDASGVSENDASIEAEFVVLRGGQERYRKVLSAEHRWPSSFVGGVAIPRAAQSYPRVVEALLRKLYADADFAAALR